MVSYIIRNSDQGGIEIVETVNDNEEVIGEAKGFDDAVDKIRERPAYKAEKVSVNIFNRIKGTVENPKPKRKPVKAKRRIRRK